MQPPLTIVNLATDESFINYCLNRNTADTARWKQFAADHPELRPMLEEATVFVMALHHHGQVAESTVQKKKLQELMRQGQHDPLQVQVGSNKLRPLFIRIAAAVILMLIATGTYYQWNLSYPTKKIIVSTRKGQLKRFVLPDSSVVWLNAATTIRFNEPFARNRSLELLDGEAYFQVVHDSKHPFSVMTASGMKVTDLGTAFSVKSYNSFTMERVGVIEGVVTVSNNKYKADSVKAGQATISDKTTGALRMETFTAADGRWMSGTVTLTNVSFEELRQDLERLYNIQIIFDTPGIASCRITTSFSNIDPISQILDALHMIYGITYTYNGNAIHIKGQPCK
ncbi:FecR family protein [Chitinophaga sp. Cy-1792]|uniref:FecR family protein n=1 Tax=Chitinophaga sp. Cy-1792 TaxID=2608339 RepID=UPI0014218288|nr:FecR domain-containing protein [Chitinophaga sp. Cy-1792]NIG54377.1 DUF4974 domain-containing protein [Chitinophaga sp. Cy-1792]